MPLHGEGRSINLAKYYVNNKFGLAHMWLLGAILGDQKIFHWSFDEYSVCSWGVMMKDDQSETDVSK